MKGKGDEIELGDFLREALNLQVREKCEALSEERLKAIAIRCGFSEMDWADLCRELENRLLKGRQFLEYENAEDAVEELEKAVALAPYRADILADCGRAHALLWQRKKVKSSRERSLDLFARALEIDASHNAAAKGLSEVKQQAASRNAPRKGVLALSCATAATVTALLFVAVQRHGDWAPATALPFIESGPPPALESIKPGAPPEGAQVFQGKAFLIVQEDIPWPEAKKRCEEMGGRLAVVNDRATLEFLRGLKKGKRLWLGATDEHEEGDWRWIDGTPVTIDAWSARQPFNLYGLEHYLEIGPEGNFNDVGVEGPTEKFRINGFICEWDLGQSTKALSVGTATDTLLPVSARN